MKILNLYYSSTGNTQKVADSVDRAVQDMGHSLESINVKANKDTEVDVLEFDFVFVGSGIYAWLPGSPLQDLLISLRKEYVKKGQIKPASPKLPDKKAAVYCSYGGAHTGINEAIPAVKYMAQLFDHLGFLMVDEIYTVGEYIPQNMQEMSYKGRLGDIRGRPNEQDLQEVEARVKGILQV